ncbi:TolC family protein [Draconibacterium sp. IB214405]|uniref:TolC family protein n=1 Tax=Draconibacterium sp. IB214405 TaxID=3097352 RepID=UPI002A0ED69C|nr:TolC family protein [Draconibacterium sp. IB214405]MDX8339823.1 TolC family protein [Draconibacterium sp. IB214405]
MKKITTIIIVFISALTTVQAQTLSDYFEIAAENNPGLQAQYKDFEAALQKVPQVSSLPDPTFSFGYFISPVETRVGPQRAKFSLSQMFPWFGTLEAQSDAASLMADAKYQAFLDARNRLYYSVSEAYYPLIELNRLKAIEQENIEILQSYKTISNSKFKNGVSPMTDVLRVDIMLKDAQTNLRILTKKEKPLLVTFNNLLNRDENETVVLQDSLTMELLPENFRRDSLLTNNPMLDAIDLKQQASAKSELAARRQGLPKLGVGVDYAIVGKRTDMEVNDNGKNVFMPMVSASIPIFRKKYRAAEKEAQLTQEKYSFQKEETINSLTSGYESIWFQIQQQKDLIDLYEAQILESNQTLNLLFSAYGNSGKDFEEVLRMQQQLLKYEKMKAMAETQYQTALAKLNYITAKTY